jgi:hypothetical protein
MHPITPVTRCTEDQADTLGRRMVREQRRAHPNLTRCVAVVMANLGVYRARAEHSLQEQIAQPLPRSDFPPYRLGGSRALLSRPEVTLRSELGLQGLMGFLVGI